MVFAVFLMILTRVEGVYRPIALYGVNILKLITQ